MKIRIDVKDRREGESIHAALADPEVRAFVITMGVLRALPSDRARERVLRFVDDHFDEADPAYVAVFPKGR